MTLADLIAKRSSSTPLEEASVEAPGVASSPVAAESATEVSSSGESNVPKGVQEITTTQGIGIYYQAAPKRLYRILPKGRKSWVEVPSMSDILSILDKPGLPWWGMKVGIEGLLKLYWDGDVSGAPNPETMVDTIVDLLTNRKLTVNHVRDRAGDRGQDVHDALELWAEKGIVPNPEVYAPDKAGYITGLRQFVIDSGAEPLVSEVMVASAKLKFAGRFDLGADMPNGARVVTKSYPKRKSVVEAIPGGEWMLDLKTSKGVYETHHLQLAGYNLASHEAYGVRYAHQGIVHVFEDGRYELVLCKATDADFKAIRKAYDVMKGLK